MKRYLLIIFMTMLTGCVAHLSHQQCVTTNWRNLGFMDGSSGNAPRDLAQATQDCAQYGIKLDSSQYHSGWQQGAQKYCTPDSNLGFADGQAGKTLDAINARMPICMQAGVPLNLNAYSSARQKGLASYCNYENGVVRARVGQSLPSDLCASHHASQFNAGYFAGTEQLCSLAENGFALGKDNKPYPASCDPNQFPAFHAEYDRGHDIAQHMADLQDRKDSEELVDTLITIETIKYGFKETPDGFYTLGDKTSDSAKKALETVNDHVRKERHIDSEMSRLQSQC